MFYLLYGAFNFVNFGIKITHLMSTLPSNHALFWTPAVPCSSLKTYHSYGVMVEGPDLFRLEVLRGKTGFYIGLAWLLVNGLYVRRGLCIGMFYIFDNYSINHFRENNIWLGISGHTV